MKKIFALFLCFSLLVSAVSCNWLNKVENSEAEIFTDRETSESSAPDETAIENGSNPAPVQEVEEWYAPIVAEYTALLQSKQKGEVLPSAEDAADETERLLREAAIAGEDPLAMGYATKDLNSDGLNELVLMDETQQNIYGLFTVKDRAPVLLLNGVRVRISITRDGVIYAAWRSVEQGQRTQMVRIVDGALKGWEYGRVMVDETTDVYYRIQDGVRTEITKQEKMNLDSYVYGFFGETSEITRRVGFRFVPAIGERDASDAPVADFFTYDGILTAYKRIVKTYAGYTRAKWYSGEYDNLFAIGDNQSFDVFFAIFYGGVRLRPTEERFGTEYAEDGNNSYGYAKKDLNGDGVEELILMNDQYKVICIFTMKDGKAVLLKDSYGMWIGEDGLLYAERNTGDNGQGFFEAFLCGIKDGKTEYLKGVGWYADPTDYQQYWYRIDGGNHRTHITRDEGKEIYEQYDILPHGWSLEEFTRTYSGLRFIPLFSDAQPSQRHVNTFYNGTIINGTGITISEIGEEAVYFSFECVYVDGEYDYETMTPPDVYRTVLNGKMYHKKGTTSFENLEYDGYLDFNVNGVWVVITKSPTERVPCRAYLLNVEEYQSD